MTEEEKAYRVWAYERLIQMLDQEMPGTGTATEEQLRKEYAEQPA